MIQNKRKFITFIAILIAIIAWSLVWTLVGAESIVDALVVRNGYIIAFVVAVFGGLSTFTSASFLATIITLAIGGLNPFFLGLISGMGITISDLFFFYLATKGKTLLPEAYKEKLQRLSLWLKKKPSFVTYIFIYFYTGFTPLPNDILTVSLALIAYPFKKLITPLILGDITLMILIAYLAIQGVRLFG